MNTFAKHLALQSVISPVKMAPVHEVWSWSLGGQGVILIQHGFEVILGALEKFVSGWWRSENNLSSWFRLSEFELE